ARGVRHPLAAGAAGRGDGRAARSRRQGARAGADLGEPRLRLEDAGVGRGRAGAQKHGPSGEAAPRGARPGELTPGPENGLRVVGAGLGRTGTHSVKLALERLLGGRCYHMSELIERPQDTSTWHAAVRGRGIDWDGLLSGYV